MILRGEFFFTILVYYINGIHTQNPSCRLIDFNYTDSVFEFDECFTGNLFTSKSYEDESLEPFRNDSVNYLSNFVTGFSCFASRQFFHLNEFTEFDVIIYLNSDVVFDTSYIDIQVYDTDTGRVSLLGHLTVFPEWNVFNHHFAEPIENAQIEIVAFTNPEAVLAIEYLHILNSREGDEECDRMTTTTETSTAPSTIIPTTTSTSTTPSPTSSTPINSNENNIWMILSFVFLLITVVVMVISLYMLYLYKTTIRKMPFSATAQGTQIGLPRLTVTTSSRGDQIIVGVQKFQSAGFLSCAV